MQKSTLYLVAGISYLVIFFAAIFANFIVLDSLNSNPLQTLRDNSFAVSLGIMAFMVTVVFDVIVAWALHLLESKNPLTLLSTLFRMMHASIMGVAIFSLVGLLGMREQETIIGMIEQFNTIWLIGLFFFGIHLVLLAKIMHIPHWMATFITIAGVMYVVDTTAHFTLSQYDQYADLFLALVAVPSIVGEMSFTVWLINKGRKKHSTLSIK